MLALILDPGAVLGDLVQRIANVAAYAEYDPRYFTEATRTLSTLNFMLSVLKIIASYGRRVFNVIDTAKAVLQKTTGYSPVEEGSPCPALGDGGGAAAMRHDVFVPQGLGVDMSTVFKCSSVSLVNRN